MRKIVSIVVASMALFFLSFTISMAEFQAGISGTVGVYEAAGSEEEGATGAKETTTANGASKIAYPTIFVEYNTGRLIIGLDVIPGSVATEEAARTDYNCQTQTSCLGIDGTTSSVTNKASVELSRHVSLYALVPIMDTGAFIKAGVMRVDVETKDSLGTGSTYPDTTMNGASLSLGYQHDTDGAFVRAEVGYTDYEGVHVSSNTGNKVDADVDGHWGRISIGKTF